VKHRHKKYQRRKSNLVIGLSRKLDRKG